MKLKKKDESKLINLREADAKRKREERAGTIPNV